MADAGDSKSPAPCGRVGSTPTSGTRLPNTLDKLRTQKEGGYLGLLAALLGNRLLHLPPLLAAPFFGDRDRYLSAVRKAHGSR